MLQDYVRTGTYWAAIQENAADFAGATVVDVGAGSGILSLFAAQAGAARVYAVEASAMADHAAALCAANPGAGSRVTVVRARVESAGLPRACADANRPAPPPAPGPYPPSSTPSRIAYAEKA